MKIVVSSVNPVKVNAVRSVMHRIYGKVEVIPVNVDSGVSHTPFGEDEIIRGALNRAHNTLNIVKGDLSVGMEGGIVEKFNHYFLTCWCCILDYKGKIRYGCGGYMPLPLKIVRMVEKGMELGDVIDELTGINGTKFKMGAIGVMTRGLLTRQKAWENAIIYAMVDRLSPQYFQE